MPLTLRGYGAYISCDGNELEAYKVKVKDGSTVSCYIQSEAGKDFKVHWVDSKPPSHLSVEIRMDGRRMGVLSHTKQSSKTSNGGFRVATDAHCPYQFDLLDNDDDDGLPSAYSEEIGTIEIRLRRVRDFISVPFTPRAQIASGPVKEPRRKGHNLSHRVSLGEQTAVKQKSTILRPILIDDKPYVVFRFLYRPREFLEARALLRRQLPKKPVCAHQFSGSSSGGRRKRPPSEAPSLGDDIPAVQKRPRTTFGDNDDMFVAMDEDVRSPTIAPDAEMIENNEENVVEVVHLSSRDNYSIPREYAGAINVKKESSLNPESSPSIKRVPSPPFRRETTPPLERRKHVGRPIASQRSLTTKRKRSPLVKRQPQSPVCVKREQTSERVPTSPTVPPQEHIKPEKDDGEEASPEVDWDENEETLVEIHVSSRNQHIVFGNNAHSPMLEREPSVKREPAAAP